MKYQNQNNKYWETASIHYPVTVPKYGEKEETDKIEEFEKPLLLFPIEQVEYLSDIYQMLPSQVPNHMEETYLARSWKL